MPSMGTKTHLRHFLRAKITWAQSLGYNLLTTMFTIQSGPQLVLYVAHPANDRGYQAGY